MNTDARRAIRLLVHVRTLTCSVLCLGFLFSLPALAVNCDKKPDHPACSPGGGGGGGGGGTSGNPAIAFRDGRDSIDVIDVDGSNQTTLVDGVYGGCSYPKWSPDGQRMTYSDGARIFVADKDGSNTVDVTPDGLWWGGACALDWSQGDVLNEEVGDLIAFVGKPDDIVDVGFPDETYYEDIYVLDPDTGEVHNLTDPDGTKAGQPGVSENAVSWSPDGTRLATTLVDWGSNSTDQHQLVILNLGLDNDGVPTITSQLDVTPPASIFDPAQKISWASTSTGTSDRIIAYSDGNLHMLTFNAGGLTSVQQITGGAGQFNIGSVYFAAWSPTDDAIVFVSSGTGQGGRRGPKDAGIYRMDLSSGLAEQIFNGTPGWPDWNPAWTESP